MTEKRQFCPRGHDTFLVGRDSSYRCLECKRLGSQAARAAREAEVRAARWARQLEINKEARRRNAAERRRILKAGGPKAQEIREIEAASNGLCTTHVSDDDVCGQPVRPKWQSVGDYTCDVHRRQQKREQEAYQRERAERDRNTAVPDVRDTPTSQPHKTFLVL